MEMTDNNRQCRTGLVPTLRAYYDVFFFSPRDGEMRCSRE